jgi:hypothetical protein
VPMSCAEVVNVVSSPDALGLLADLYCAWCASSVAGQTTAAKVDGASANWDARAAFALCLDDRLSVGSGGGCCLALVGSRTGLRGIGFGGAWALADPDCGNCRRRDFGRVAMVQFTADGAIFGEGTGVYASPRRADSAAIAAGVRSLLGFGGDGGRLRGIPVSRICHGGLDPSWASRLERGATILSALWFSASLPGARWVVEHTGHRHSVRNGANRVRWAVSGSSMAFCGGRGGGSGGAKVPDKSCTVGAGSRGNSQAVAF